MKDTPEYRSWRSMKTRCLNPKDAFYARYGGRGVKICQEWIDSFEAFYADVGPRPAGTTLDRIKNSEHYAPGNVRWATAHEQQRNRSSNHLLTFRGKTMPLVSWAELIGINRHTLKTRLTKLGWSVKRALTAPLRGAA